MKTKEIVFCGLAVAILETAKLCLSMIANVELVSLLILIFTLTFGKRVFLIIYAFVFLEGAMYGFGYWWIAYLYVWSILALTVWIFRASQSIIFWVIIMGLFGLLFGAFCAIPYFVTGGVSLGMAYWSSGVYFDLIHCISNIVMTVIFYRPLYTITNKLIKKNNV